MSAFTKVKAENNYIAMKKSITKLQLFMIPFIVVSVVITIFFKPIALIWLKKELDYSYGLIPMGLMYCLLTIWTNTYASIGNGLELMKPSIIVAVVQAVLNIPLSWIFAELVGLKSAGVLVGTVMVMAISAVIMPIYIHLWIGKRIKMPSDSNNLEINTEETQSNNDAEIGQTLGKE